MIEFIVDLFSTIFKCVMVAVIIWAPFLYMNHNNCSSSKSHEGSDCSDLLNNDKKGVYLKKKQSNGLSKKDRKIIEKHIDDGYKRMKR